MGIKKFWNMCVVVSFLLLQSGKVIGKDYKIYHFENSSGSISKKCTL
jgi:hypothetical protein